MSVYYCHKCSVDLNFIKDYVAENLLGSTYQMDKYIKHTWPSTAFPVQSVFSSPSTQLYGKYIIDAKFAGSVEIDAKNRKNIIYVAGEQCGFLYENGQLARPQNAVKVVLSSSTGKIHAFPESSTNFSTAECAKCGKPIVF